LGEQLYRPVYGDPYDTSVSVHPVIAVEGRSFLGLKGLELGVRIGLQTW
jgi:hypothetical protein